MIDSTAYYYTSDVGKIWKPTFDEIVNDWRGDFGCMRIPGLPQMGAGNAPKDLLFTPAYGCYSDSWRATIRKYYKAKWGEKSKFVLNLKGNPYWHPGIPNPYPDLDVNQAGKWLDELYSDRLIPVCPLYDDADTTITYSDELLSKITCAFTKWDGADGFDMLHSDGTITGNNVDHVREARRRAPHVVLYFHMAANLGSMCGSDDGEEGANPKWWSLLKSLGVQGCLYQLYYDNVVDAINRFDDMYVRLILAQDYWPTLDLINFETTEYFAYHEGWTEAMCYQYNREINKQFPKINGFCSGS